MEKVKQQYERWPYPHYPLFAKVSREQTWQNNYQYLANSCNVNAKTRPRIWIAGCGTFQPYIFALANPGAQIIASDISEQSLKLAKRRCRYHGIRNVEFLQVDLEDETSYPSGKFDYIECFGVLMCLSKPDFVLRSLRVKLEQNGIMRIMVYPHYARTRVFQIQQYARLLGFNCDEPNSPVLLKKAIRALPKKHPLNYAFFSYYDAANKAGIVDGFLHASDRGFTAFELLSMVDKADLSVSSYLHRPWGNPSYMRELLGFKGLSDLKMLYLLDLWHELKTNFILLLSPKDKLTGGDAQKLSRHPLFDFSNSDLSLTYKLKTAGSLLTGMSLPHKKKAEMKIRFSSSELKEIIFGTKPHPEVLLSLNEINEPSSQEFKEHSGFVDEEKFKNLSLRSGSALSNPFYRHFFQAFYFDSFYNSIPEIPTLETLIGKWQAHGRAADPDYIEWGISPIRAFLKNEEAVFEFMSKAESATEPFDLSNFDLKAEKLNQVDWFLKQKVKVKRSLSDEEKLRLWLLVFSFDKLFLNLA